MLYNIALSYEVMIVLGFWGIILPGILYRDSTGSEGSDQDSQFSIMFIIVAAFLDHSVSFIVLLIDFTFNCVPIIWRHFTITWSILILYMIMNAIYSLKVHSIYPVLDWHGFIGITLPILCVLAMFLIQLVIIKINACKLRKNNKSIVLH